MKDERGLYYYPSPSNHRERMYVKEAEGVVWFRMWDAAEPTLWEQHDWVPYAAILRAAEMYDGKNFDPAGPTTSMRPGPCCTKARESVPSVFTIERMNRNSERIPRSLLRG